MPPVETADDLFYIYEPSFELVEGEGGIRRQLDPSLSTQHLPESRVHTEFGIFTGDLVIVTLRVPTGFFLKIHLYEKEGRPEFGIAMLYIIPAEGTECEKEGVDTTFALESFLVQFELI